jgi:hypothetical protein
VNEYQEDIRRLEWEQPMYDTAIRTGYWAESDGYRFTLEDISIVVEDPTTNRVVGIIPVLDANGHRNVRTTEAFETEVAFWIKDHT